jgi:hypothetical protein
MGKKSEYEADLVDIFSGNVSKKPGGQNYEITRIDPHPGQVMRDLGKKESESGRK